MKDQDELPKGPTNKDFFVQCALFQGNRDDKEVGIIFWGLLAIFVCFIIALWTVKSMM